MKTQGSAVEHPEWISGCRRELAAAGAPAATGQAEELCKLKPLIFILEKNPNKTLKDKHSSKVSSAVLEMKLCVFLLLSFVFHVTVERRDGANLLAHMN